MKGGVVIVLLLKYSKVGINVEAEILSLDLTFDCLTVGIRFDKP